MRKLTQFLMMLTLGLFLAGTSMAQVTTSGMNGKVTGPDGNPLIGATVVAIHVPTGTQFGGISDDQGFFRLPNMDVGGPYTVKVTYVGYESWTMEGVYLTLGQTFQINPSLKSTAVKLGEVAVVGRRGNIDVFDGNRTGSETFVSLEKMDAMPTVGRDLTDFTRLTPQATVDDNSAISIAGVNNRYNSLTIDGGYQNDAFGLAASGVNGGQTGGTPISLDAIEQFQIVLAPYDVRQSGFAGAGINAVTRRGTNEFTGSIYTFYRDQNLSGRTPTNRISGYEDMTKEELDAARTQLPDFQAMTSGFRLGGPIIKNKLHFFVNGEMQRDATPQPFSIDGYNGDATAADLDALADYVKTNYGYDPGPYDDFTSSLKSNKFLARLDWNINEDHKLMLRHSYTQHESVSPYRASSTSMNFFNNGVYFPSTTNSTTVELKSNFDNMSNDLIAVFTTVRDDRDPMGTDGSYFPSVRIYDGSGTIYMGSEAYSTANELNQDIFTLTDNFSIYKGKHTITIGTSNEFAGVYNLFMRKNFGEYRFYSLDDFYAGNPFQYERGYSLVDDITGDGSAAAADFKMLQVGIYAQDEFQASDDFKLTFGLRADMPIFLDAPGVDTHFNETTIPMLEAAGWDLMGAQAGQMPKSQVLLSPRLGFNWDVKGDETTQVRGGVGIFTSRLPLVWPGGSYTNNGLTIGGVYYRGSDIVFSGDWQDQYENTDFGMADAIPSGQMDLFSADFKFPQVFRANLGVDQKLGWGLIASVDAIFTKTLNNVNYYNLNVSPTAEFNLTGADNRPYYSSSSIDPTYTRIMLGTNTNEGYAYNFSAMLEKPFENGLTANLSYSFGRSMAINDATSSQNSSQWRYMEQVGGLNNLALSVSDFDQGHRITGFLSYRKEYFNHAATQISVFYNGQSGRPFSYVYNDYGDMNGESENSGNLLYVPASQDEIVFDDAATADAQWAALNEYIENDPYLSTRRGQYAERNAARTPFSNMIDLKIAQDVFMNIAGKRHKLQVTLDVFNLGNMINPSWGRRWYVSNDAFTLVDFEGFADDGTTPTFSFETPRNTWSADDSGLRSSRWMAQLGVRYTF